MIGYDCLVVILLMIFRSCLMLIAKFFSRICVCSYLLCLMAVVNIFMVSCTKTPDTTVSKADSTSAHTTSELRTIMLTEEQVRVAGIEFGIIEKRSMSGLIKVNGMLDVPPQNLVSLSPHIGGFVESVLVLEGEFVRKGQVIAVLEHQDYIVLQEEYISAKSRVEFLEAEYKRQEELQKENINATKTYQQIKSEYHALRGRVAGLEQRLRLLGLQPNDVITSTVRSTCTIVAPIDGYITKVLSHRGKYLAPQDILCEIVNTDHLHAELMVFEKDVMRIRPRQKVRVRLSTETDERMASVYLIGREVSHERMVRIHAHLDREDTHLLPYTALSALIETEPKSVWTVPESALINSAGKEYIVIADSVSKSNTMQSPLRQRFTVLPIQRGMNAGGFVEIIVSDDIRPEMVRLVVRGAYSIVSHAIGNVEGHDH